MSGTRIKYLYQIVDKRAGSRELPLLAVSIHRGVVPRNEITDDPPRADDLSNYKLCQAGDLVLNRMRAFQGAIGISPQHGLVSPDYLVLRPSKSVNARYLHHLFRSTWFIGEMVSRLRGIGNTENGAVRTPRINPEDLGDIAVDLPQLDEQWRIADFLDVETTRIDELITLHSKQINLLREKFANLRSQVTAELAIRHGAIKLRHILLRIEQGWSPQCEDRVADEGEWGVIKAGCVNGGAFRLEQHKALPAELRPRKQYQLRPGDLLMSRASGSPDLIGSVGLVPEQLPRPMLLCDKVYRLIVDQTRVKPDFIAQVLQTAKVRREIVNGISGADGMANNLPTSVVTELKVPIAPLDVQGEFVAQLLDNRAATEELCDALDDQIRLLAERRQALITAAVTGQLDVTTARPVTP